MSGDDLDGVLAKMQTEMDAVLEDEESLKAFMDMRLEDATHRHADGEERKRFQSQIEEALNMLSRQLNQLAAVTAQMQKFAVGHANHVGGQIAALENQLSGINETLAAPKEIIRNADGRPTGVRIKRGPI